MENILRNKKILQTAGKILNIMESQPIEARWVILQFVDRVLSLESGAIPAVTDKELQ